MATITRTTSATRKMTRGEPATATTEPRTRPDPWSRCEPAELSVSKAIELLDCAIGVDVREENRKEQETEVPADIPGARSRLAQCGLSSNLVFVPRESGSRADGKLLAVLKIASGAKLDQSQATLSPKQVPSDELSPLRERSRKDRETSPCRFWLT